MHIIIRCGTNPIVSNFEWEIPNKFKQQVFEFLESLQNRFGEEYARGVEGDKEIALTIEKLFRNLNGCKGNFKEILERFYNTAYENGKQSQ